LSVCSSDSPACAAKKQKALHALQPKELAVAVSHTTRLHCIVVGRASDSQLLNGLAPSAPAFLGYEEQPLLDGWEAHRAVLDHLAHHASALP
jgi:hypothetical protein